MKRTIQILIILLSYNYCTAKTKQGVGCLYQDLNLINTVAKVVILDKAMAANADTCQNGTIHVLEPSPLYTCRLIDRIYGNISDSIFTIRFILPSIIQYDDSCRILGQWHVLRPSLNGLEFSFVSGDTVYVLLNSLRQMITARGPLSEFDKFVVKHYGDLKEISKKNCMGYTTISLGVTKTSQFCCLTISHELLNGKYAYVPYVAFYKQGITEICKTLPYKPKCAKGNFEHWDSNIVRTFKRKNHKILIFEGLKRTKLIIP